MDAVPDRPPPLRPSSLYWRDRNLRFHRYDLIEPSGQAQTLLDEVDTDPTCIFWG